MAPSQVAARARARKIALCSRAAREGTLGQSQIMAAMQRSGPPASSCMESTYSGDKALKLAAITPVLRLELVPQLLEVGSKSRDLQGGGCDGCKVVMVMHVLVHATSRKACVHCLCRHCRFCYIQWNFTCMHNYTNVRACGCVCVCGGGASEACTVHTAHAIVCLHMRAYLHSIHRFRSAHGRTGALSAHQA